MKGVSLIAVAFVGGLVIGGICSLITLLATVATW